MIINTQIYSVGENSYYESVSVKANKAEENSFELKGNEKFMYIGKLFRRFSEASILLNVYERLTT